MFEGFMLASNTMLLLLLSLPLLFHPQPTITRSLFSWLHHRCSCHLFMEILAILCGNMNASWQANMTNTTKMTKHWSCFRCSFSSKSTHTKTLSHTNMHTQIQREREKNSIYTTYTLINMQPSTNTYKHLIHLTHRHTHTHTCIYINISVIILLSSLILNGLCVVFADGPLQNNINHFIGFCIFSIKSYNNFHNSMTQLGSNRFLSNSSAWKVYGKLNVIQTSTVINKKIINI